MYTVFVLVGGTGDLARKKIYPAMFRIEKEHFITYGIGSRFDSQQDYISFLMASTDTDSMRNMKSMIDARLSCFFYAKIDWENPQETFKFVASDMFTRAKNIQRVVFYLCTNDSSAVFLQRYLSIIADTMKDMEITSYICIEKPIGANYTEAEQIINFAQAIASNRLKILYVDHFLFKRSIRDLSKPLEQIVNYKPFIKPNISHINIYALEDLDVGNRHILWERIGGIVNDMIQSHILLMIDHICKILGISFSSLSPINCNTSKYLSYKGKKATFAAASFSNGEVSASAVSGKRLAAKKTCIHIISSPPGVEEYIVKINIAPQQNISLLHGDVIVYTVPLFPDHTCAYQNMIVDLLNDDLSYFVNPDIILECWRKVDSMQSDTDKAYQEGTDILPFVAPHNKELILSRPYDDV